jgi:hypothetical protein
MLHASHSGRRGVLANHRYRCDSTTKGSELFATMVRAQAAGRLSGDAVTALIWLGVCRGWEAIPIAYAGSDRAVRAHHAAPSSA